MIIVHQCKWPPSHCPVQVWIPGREKRQHQTASVFSHYFGCFKLKRNIVESSIFCAPCRKRRWSVDRSWSSSHMACSHRGPCCPPTIPWKSWFSFSCVLLFDIILHNTFHCIFCYNMLDVHTMFTLPPSRYPGHGQ